MGVVYYTPQCPKVLYNLKKRSLYKGTRQYLLEGRKNTPAFN